MVKNIGSQLKGSQIKVAGLLAGGATVSEAADKAGLARSTINRWLRDDANFVAYLNTLKETQLEATRTALQAASGEAVKTLLHVMKNSKSDAAKVSAAKEVLAMTGFTKETVELYSWGVGPTDPDQVRVDMDKEDSTARFLKVMDRIGNRDLSSFFEEAPE